MYYPRTLQQPWLQASNEFPVLLLTGPRQVGKTTLLRELSQNRRYVTLDDVTLRDLARHDPALFLQRYPPPVLIDEIQYAPQLLPSIKIAVDRQQQPGDFWLTGSQQFQMMQGLTESLAGRLAVVQLLGFSQRETEQQHVTLPPFLPDQPSIQQRSQVATQKNLEEVYENIWRGSHPALVTGEITSRELFYNSYIQTYLERDVRALTQVGSLERFSRFIRACAARTGQLLNYSDLARDADISVNTAKSWLSILEASFQIQLLKPLHSHRTKRLYKLPKLYFLDTGLCAYLCEWTSPETLEAGAMSGAFLETYAIVEILKSWWHNMLFPTFHYYRDKDGKEIDLIVARGQQYYALEIKKSATPRTEWARVFATLERVTATPVQGAVLCLAADNMPLNERVECVPIGYL